MRVLFFVFENRFLQSRFAETSLESVPSALLQLYVMILENKYEFIPILSTVMSVASTGKLIRVSVL